MFCLGAGVYVCCVCVFVSVCYECVCVCVLTTYSTYLAGISARTICIRKDDPLYTDHLQHTRLCHYCSPWCIDKGRRMTPEFWPMWRIGIYF